MDYQALKSEYDKLLELRAAELSISVDEYLKSIVNNYQLELHTMEIAEMVRGYIECGQLNVKLSEDGLLDINGDTSR